MSSPGTSLRRALQARHLEWRARKVDPAPFVVGHGRSGTTLLRLMLDAHPQLAIPPETQFIPQLIDASKDSESPAAAVADELVGHRRFGDFGFTPEEVRGAFAAIEPFDIADALRWFYGTYAERQGKARWGDKSPGYGWRMRRINRVLPEARFVHLIRDGRDVILSMRAQNESLPHTAKLARHWVQRVRRTRRQGAQARHYMDLRYEDLVADPEPHLRRICEFIELPYDPVMLRYHERAGERLSEIARDMKAGRELSSRTTRGVVSGEHRVAIHERTKEPPRSDRVAKWKREMSAADRAEFERVAGDVLAELGYETLER